MIIRPLTKWLFVGGSDGYNLVFTVGHIESDGNVINAWSDPEQGGEDEAGFLWAGGKELFLRSFKPLGPPEEIGA